MSNPRRSRPDDPVRDGVTDRNGTSGNGMAGDGMSHNGAAGRHSAEPMATPGGQARMESRSGTLPDDGRSATREPDGGYAPQPDPTAMSERVQSNIISLPNA